MARPRRSSSGPTLPRPRGTNPRGPLRRSAPADEPVTRAWRAARAGSVEGGLWEMENRAGLRADGAGATVPRPSVLPEGGNP